MYKDDDGWETVALEDLLEDARFEEAQALLARVVEMAPEDSWARSMRALCFVELRRSDEALAEARMAVAVDGESPFALWTLGSILCDRRQLDDALVIARRGIELDPQAPYLRGLIAQIHALRGDWKAARAAAETGLQLDPDDEVCSNLLALSMRGTDTSEQWAAAIDDLVVRYPASGWARAGKGWHLLEVGRARDARENFEQALALDPTSEWARHGLIESIKAQSSVYAALLRLFLWLDRLPPRIRWSIFLGGIFAFRVLRTATSARPDIAVVTYPLMAVWVMFVLSTWIAEPLSDFILSRTRNGRCLVRGDQRLAADLVAASIGSAITAAIAWAITGADRAGEAAFVLAVLVLPVSAVFKCEPGWPRKVMAAYTTVVFLACIAVIVAPADIADTAFVTAIVMAVLGTWIGAFLAGRIPERR